MVALVPVFAYSLEITLKTDKPSYHGSEYVYISGLLTYNYWPITNELVSVEVLDPQNLTMLIVTRLTDSEGKYNYTFRLPDSAKTGTYTVKVVAEHFELIARNQAIFEVTSSNTIYIRADGSIEPITAPIHTEDNITYTFTGDIYETIEVEKSYVTIDGADHILQGNGAQYSKGFHLAGNNITIKNAKIRGFWWGVEFIYTSGHVITQNIITDNMIGINSHIRASDSVISKNFIANKNTGIRIYESVRNTIVQNKIVNNEYGIAILFESSSNTVTGNVIAKNIVDISLSGHLVKQNTVFHNSFLCNDYQVFGYELENAWDDSYPSGGNYWSDYISTDLYQGPYQNETGSDGIGDTPYVIGAGATDRYPLMNPHGSQHDIGILAVVTSRTIVWEGLTVNVNITIGNYGSTTEIFSVTVHANTTVIHTFADVTLTKGSLTTLAFTWDTIGHAKGTYFTSVHALPVPEETEVTDNSLEGGLVVIAMPYDLNGDGKVDLKEIFQVAKAYGSCPGRPNWDPNADVDNDLKVDLKDYYTICKHYGTSYP